ncbi:MAG: hypothetical protein WCF99_05055 [Chloroflexales bacterium]
MIQHGFIQPYANPIDQLRAVLAFFGIATPAQRYIITASHPMIFNACCSGEDAVTSAPT